MKEIKYIGTEKRNSRTMNLDSLCTADILKLINDEDKKVAVSVQKKIEDIERCVDFAFKSISNGGRLIYIGAGTSGRLGLLDAVECPPTFSVSTDVIVGVIAGGENAFVKAVEGAEDNMELGRGDLEKIFLTDKDTVVGITASGRTPYVIGGLMYAREIGASTVSISCNNNSETSKYADVFIELDTGAEVLAGSTRLKAGTAQKMVLNMISTASMIRLGKCYKNLMVDVNPTNYKLRLRSQNIVVQATGCSEEDAKRYLELSQYKPKTAIVMILLGCSKEEALKRLEEANGHIKNILN